MKTLYIVITIILLPLVSIAKSSQSSEVVTFYKQNGITLTENEYKESIAGLEKFTILNPEVVSEEILRKILRSHPESLRERKGVVGNFFNTKELFTQYGLVLEDGTNGFIVTSAEITEDIGSLEWIMTIFILIILGLTLLIAIKFSRTNTRDPEAYKILGIISVCFFVIFSGIQIYFFNLSFFLVSGFIALGVVFFVALYFFNFNQILKKE